MRKILITGKNSYVGNSVVSYLNSYVENYKIGVEDVQLDEWKHNDFSGYDTILHVAAIVHKKEDKSMKDLYQKVNVDLPVELALKAKASGVRTFIFMSSMSVYGLHGEMINHCEITNQTKTNPNTLYATTKLQAENALMLLADESFKVIILRPPMVYGDKSPGNYQRLKAFARWIPIFPNIENQRSMIEINQLTSYIKCCIDTPKTGIFFPQDTEYVSTKKWMEQFAQENNRKIYFIKIFNPILYVCGSKITTIKKLFGNLTYSKDLK